MEVLGKCLLFAGLCSIGLVAAQRLQRRASCLRDFLGALERLARALSFALPRVDVLLLEMERGCRQESLAFFKACRARFAARGEERLEELWSVCLQAAALPIGEEECRLLDALGAVLGRFDGESQVQAAQQLHARLELYAAKASEEAARLGRVYVVLGICLGLFFVLLL